MKKPCSVSVVVPSFCSGPRLWLGTAELLRFHNPLVNRLQVLVVDDASPQCAFREGSLSSGRTELIFLVNPVNIGQSRTCLRGLAASNGDWIIFLEDDLLDWNSVISALVNGMTNDVDLVNLDRGLDSRAVSTTRRTLQPLVRAAFRAATGFKLEDPTSPVKAVRRAAFPLSTAENWGDSLAEGLLLNASSAIEVTSPTISWDDAPSRYSTPELLAAAARLAPRVAARVFRRGGRS